MSPTIETIGQRCRRDCARTFRYEHGHDLPAGPLPGTLAQPGDLRRCDHNRLWVYLDTTEYGRLSIDVWERLSPWRTPTRYRRAARALRQSPASERNTP